MASPCLLLELFHLTWQKKEEKKDPLSHRMRKREHSSTMSHLCCETGQWS